MSLSRQLLDQQVVEQKVEKLLQRQLALTSEKRPVRRNSRKTVRPLIMPDSKTLCRRRNRWPMTGAQNARSGVKAIETIMGIAARMMIGLPAPPSSAMHRLFRECGWRKRFRPGRQVFSNVTLSLKGVEREQMAHLRQMNGQRTKDVRDDQGDRGGYRFHASRSRRSARNGYGRGSRCRRSLRRTAEGRRYSIGPWSVSTLLF